MKPIFISHATADDKIADEFYHALTAHSLTLWMDPQQG
jgi:hypothetical protein